MTRPTATSDEDQPILLPVPMEARLVAELP
jgi:hypothetical protein